VDFFAKPPGDNRDGKFPIANHTLAISHDKSNVTITRTDESDLITVVDRTWSVVEAILPDVVLHDKKYRTGFMNDAKGEFLGKSALDKCHWKEHIVEDFTTGDYQSIDVEFLTNALTEKQEIRNKEVSEEQITMGV
jgi:hypothetical protein